MDKKLMILICFFSMLTLISSIICSSLVFFNEKARTEVNGNKVLAQNNIYKSTTINYSQNNTLNLSGLTPGYTLEQSFSIVNNNSNTIKYSIVWSNVVSTWNMSSNNMAVHPDEFAYTLNCSNGEKITKQMPTSKEDYIIFENLELKTNKANDCTIKVSFINTGADQSYNLNKSFRGTYKIIVTE